MDTCGAATVYNHLKHNMFRCFWRNLAPSHWSQQSIYCIHLDSSQVADQYAFIPREAVSRFLIHCSQCQRKPAQEVKQQGNRGDWNVGTILCTEYSVQST